MVAVERGTIVGPPDSPFNMPSDIAVAPDGTVFVLDGVNHRVVVYNAEGQLRFQFGSPGSGFGQLDYPLGMAAGPEGDLYVADSGNHRVQVFTAEGKPVEVIPLPAAANDSPPDPTGVAVDSIRGRLYLADNDNHRIAVYDLADRRFDVAWGGPGQGQRQLRFPFLMALSAEGYLFVVESINTRVQVLNPEGKFVAFIGGWGIEPGQLFRPKGVALRQSRVFVTDSYLGTIQVFDLNGRFLGALTDATGTKMVFTTPTGIAVDPGRNRLYVVELKAHRVRALDLEAGSGNPQPDLATQQMGSVGSPGPVGPSARSSPQASSPAGKDTLSNSSRECAICHVRWVQAFDRDRPPEGAMLDVLERKAGSGEMCLSCHDGSVTDSRFKVWATRHHATDVVPSPAVDIPTEEFPLDGQGRMTCATCHTAHAVPGDSDLRTVIFLRRPNVDSSLCLACHPQHAQKNEFQHPLGQSQSPVPKVILEAGGKTSPDGHTILCQTCHEPHGAKNTWMLVLPPSELCVACHTAKAPEISPPAGAPVHRIGHTYAGFRPPATLLQERAAFGAQGELTCLSCHRLHDASGARPLLIRGNQDSSLCLECHQKEKALLGSSHDLRVSSPEAANAHGENASASGPCGTCHRAHGWARTASKTDRPQDSQCLDCHGPDGPASHARPYVAAHPVGVAMPKGRSIPLPLDEATRALGCLTCHDPHAPGPAPTATENSTGHLSEQAGATSYSFLRREGSQLCTLCHDQMTNTQRSHDPANFPPKLQEMWGVSPAAGSCRVCHTAHNTQGPHLQARPPGNFANGAIPNLCQACHNEGILPSPAKTHHPLSAPQAGTTSGNAQSSISCLSCHHPHGSTPSPAQLRHPPEGLCLTCHEDKQQIAGSVHDPGATAWGQSLGLPFQGLCLDCHPIHGPAEQAGVWKALGPVGDPNDRCTACHRPGGPGTPVRTAHVGKTFDCGAKDVRDVNPPSPIQEPQSHVSCTSCHDIHQGSPTRNSALGGPRNQPGSKLLRASRQDGTLCLTCHPASAPILGTAHDLRKSAPATHNVHDESPAESGPCGVCHSIHGTSVAARTWAQGIPAGSRAGEGLCTGCHYPGRSAETRVPSYVDHPAVPLQNRFAPGDPDYLPTFDEQGRPSPTGTISCPTCHQIHAGKGMRPPGREARVEPPTPPVPQASSLLRTTGQRFCADCHGMQTPWRFLYYHQANRNPHPNPAPAGTP
jgi:predicted CXXCH cytochrome family protein